MADPISEADPEDPFIQEYRDLQNAVQDLDHFTLAPSPLKDEGES